MRNSDLLARLRAARWQWLAGGAVFLAAAAELGRQGRRWWCACGGYELWWSDIHSAHNSQHLLDPYSFTHIEHGILIYGLLAWLCPRLSTGWRLVVAFACEGAWEIVENTSFVIDRYRATTVSLDYYGDSIANSLGDMLCGGVGFLLARRLGFRWSLAALAAIEIVLLFWIRDNLLLNVLQLLYPFSAVKKWQTGD